MELDPYDDSGEPERQLIAHVILLLQRNPLPTNLTEDEINERIKIFRTVLPFGGQLSNRKIGLVQDEPHTWYNAYEIASCMSYVNDPMIRRLSFLYKYDPIIRGQCQNAEIDSKLGLITIAIEQFGITAIEEAVIDESATGDAGALNLNA